MCFPASHTSPPAQSLIMIQHRGNRFKCGPTQKAFNHVTLYVCVTLPINPQRAGLVGSDGGPAGHRGKIPDAALFHNSHHVWFFQGAWRIPARRGDQLLVITTRLSPVWEKRGERRDGGNDFQKLVCEDLSCDWRHFDVINRRAYRKMQVTPSPQVALVLAANTDQC